jgi:transposase-like protein
MTNDSISLPRFQLDGAAKTGRPRDDADEGLFNSWFDPIEHAVRDRVRFFIEELIESELATVLARPRYGRRAKDGSCVETSAGVVGHRHGSRTRTLTGTFGRTEIAVPRARLMQPDGGTTEWKSQALRAYPRRTRAAEALIASAYLAGVNTRRVRRALTALFGGAVGKDIVSRTWRKVKGDWDSWNARSLADEPIVRLILDGTVVRVRLDRKATAISLLVVIGVRADGQKVLLAVRSMGGESAEAWRTVLDDLIMRGLRRPEFLIVDGAGGIDKAIAAVWDGVPAQRCTVHKHRNLLAHAPERLHEEITADYPVTRYLPSRACRRASGRARERPMRSNGCTRSSSGGSRRKPCCPPPKPPPCCSGRCSPQDRSTCERSTAGGHSPPSPSLSPLTSPPETIASCHRRPRHSNFQPNSRRHAAK